jgi:hypothetical protein
MWRLIGIGMHCLLFELHGISTKTKFRNSFWHSNWLFLPGRCIAKEFFPCITEVMLAVMNWHILVMEQHAMVRQQVWPLPHLHPLNPLVLQRKQKRKWAPQREPQARDMVPTMVRNCI